MEENREEMTSRKEEGFRCLNHHPSYTGGQPKIIRGRKKITSEKFQKSNQ